jgi:hypothetical protein
VFPLSFSPRLFLPVALGLAAASAFTVSGCSPSAKETAREAGESVGEAARDVGTATGQAALAPAVNPVLDLLRKAEAELTTGRLAAAVATMGGFEALWVKASPVIQPLAGDRWPSIDAAAKVVLSTFDKQATPDAQTAKSAITGLIGPLSALLKP